VLRIPATPLALGIRQSLIDAIAHDTAEALALNPETVKKDRQRRSCQMGTILYKRDSYMKMSPSASSRPEN